MGIYIGWVVRERWFFIAGFLIVGVGVFVPWPDRPIRDTLLILGIAVMAIQLPVIALRARAERSLHEPARPDRGSIRRARTASQEQGDSPHKRR